MPENYTHTYSDKSFHDSKQSNYFPVSQTINMPQTILSDKMPINIR